ncbi:hypothetical protein [Amycolatopsis sp. WQ 127309]|uniref:hypothetical protein n=1 Tax=Amycolatopsis sp. WQ 127309 TaxID=2932773 RepID=UPI001FF3931A|nr:hypothetical protein [Amycolatopsis sp. WQ 127309]UOZ09917.1 hypothetical protein MUY22_17250 [Amycolatopsis sp. WQ 127309]
MAGECYVSHSRFTDPGPHAGRLDGTPARHDDVAFDLLDVPRDRFLVGAAAWTAARAGDVDPARPGPAEPARAAELPADPDVEQLRVVFEADDVRVPPVIRSVIPPGPVPVEVVLR